MSRLLRTPESHADLATPEVKVLDIDTLRIFETFYPELGPERGRAGRRGVRSRHIVPAGRLEKRAGASLKNGWHE